MRLDDVDGRYKPWDKPGHDAGAADVASPLSSKGPAAGRYELATAGYTLVGILTGAVGLS